MTTLFFMGVNRQNVSGVSWKLWRINRQGCTVRLSWGPAKLDARRVVPSHSLQTKTLVFSSEEVAIGEEKRRIAEKLRNGYERKPRRRR